MFKNLFKYRSEIGIVTIVTVVLTLLGWFIKVNTREAVVPLNHQMMIGFKGVDQQLGIMNQKIIQIDDKHEALSEKLDETMNYQHTLRVEVKNIAESKVDKEDAWRQYQSVDERLDEIELGSAIHKKDHNGHSKK